MKFNTRFFSTLMATFMSFLMLLISLGCTGLNEDSKDFDVQFKVPETLTVNFGSKTLDFRVMFGKAPLVTDKVVFGEPSGQLKTFSITETSQTKFTISLDQELVSGTHNIYIQRGNLKKQMGVTEVQITYNSTGGDDIKLAEGNNVYGIVSCGSVGLKDVVVSDGKVVTKTDSKGVYQFKSDKKHGYVFISVPSGYEAISEGILPKIHQQLVKPVATAERLDFPLVEAPGQEKHNILFFGDFQISNRNGDRKQFATFTSEVNEYLAANKGTKTYAITLGDMTWDLYWYSKMYGLEEYLADANQMKDLQIFHTIGNHDHDMNAAGDFYTVTKYKKVLAPTYFSFNIGGVHYVILDNIYCTNPGDGSTTRTYNDKIDAEQMEWLKKDLSYVPTSMPLVISLHAPVYTDSGSNSTDNASELEALVGKYEKVHYFTGHTHKMYNIDKLSEKKMYEHNAGAVCATWWWTGHLTSNKIHIGQDGAAGGYLIMNVDGKDFKWQFKATGKPLEHQFRTYDGNEIHLTTAKYTPSANDTYKKKFEEFVGSWGTSNKENYIYINVWDYDPSWKIEVTENGKALKVEQITAKDPLHLIAYSSIRYNGNNDLSFGTSNTKHFFRAKASAANTTVTVKVTDRFGNVYTEEMTRPKAFAIDTYK